LPDTNRVYEYWRLLILQNSIRGLQVHDDKLAAAMLAHGVPNILTFNTADFARYTGIEAVHPSDIKS
jgi:predicted nucleic acid-binding protein